MLNLPRKRLFDERPARSAKHRDGVLKRKSLQFQTESFSYRSLHVTELYVRKNTELADQLRVRHGDQALRVEALPLSALVGIRDVHEITVQFVIPDRASGEILVLSYESDFTSFR